MDAPTGIDGGEPMSNVTPIYQRFLVGDDGQADAFGTSPIWIDDTGWDEASIPRRAWVVLGYLIRGAVTVLSGPGSAGKSQITLAWAIALALGVRFSRFHPYAPATVVIYNVEDDADEQRRRMSAILRQFRAKPSDIAGRIIRIGPQAVGTLLRTDTLTKRLTPTAVLNEIETLLEERKPDVLFLDPMVELHDAEENDNTAVRMFMARLRALAIKYNCAICLIHHARKGVTGAAGDPDSLRGASAIVGAARVVLTLLTMDEEEAKSLGIPTDRRRGYFRLDGAKSNYAPIEEAEWLQRVEYELANGERVAAAEPWIPPSVWKDMTPDAIGETLTKIEAGPAPGILYAPSKRGAANGRWVGNAIMTVMGLNENQAGTVVRAWQQSGMLIEVSYRDTAARKDRVGVSVDRSKQP